MCRLSLHSPRGKEKKKKKKILAGKRKSRGHSAEPWGTPRLLLLPAFLQGWCTRRPLTLCHRPPMPTCSGCPVPPSHRTQGWSHSWDILVKCLQDGTLRPRPQCTLFAGTSSGTSTFRRSQLAECPVFDKVSVPLGAWCHRREAPLRLTERAKLPLKKRALL